MDTKQDDIIQNQLGGAITASLLSIYREAIPDPGHENQDTGLQSIVTSEDEQILYARYFRQSSAVRLLSPPSLSTTFLRELKDWEASTSTFASEDTIEVTFFFFFFFFTLSLLVTMSIYLGDVVIIIKLNFF